MNIYNVIILDESGSMSSIYRETIQTVNEVLGGIRRNQEEFPGQRHFVTVVTFEGDGMKGVRMRRDRVPVDTVSPFTEKDYRPGGCTPLYDAMGKTLTDLEPLVFPEDRVMVTVITDGYENASHEYSVKNIRDLAGRLREKNWVIAYAGANQDSIEVAREMNILDACNFDASPSVMPKFSKRIQDASHKMAKKAMKGESFINYSRLFDKDED